MYQYRCTSYGGFDICERFITWYTIIHRILTSAGTDYFTIEDPTSGKLYLLQRIYLDYIEFPNSQTINKPKWCC
ncbi:spore coat protein GerQ [Bacillus pacificus]